MSVKRKPNVKLEKNYAKSGGCCHYCKIKIPFFSITRDHLVPRIDGGKMVNDNWVWSCFKCNSSKGSLSLLEFKELILKRLISSLQNIADNKFLASQSQIDKFKRDTKILNSVSKLISNQ